MCGKRRGSVLTACASAWLRAVHARRAGDEAALDDELVELDDGGLAVHARVELQPEGIGNDQDVPGGGNGWLMKRQPKPNMIIWVAMLFTFG